MIIRVDAHADAPLFRQIRDGVVGALARGEMSAGDSLPSVRQMSRDLGVNLHTVNKAYAVLRDEGYVLMRRGAGAVIADRREPMAGRLAGIQNERMDDTLRRLALEFRARGGSYEEFTVESARQARAVFSAARPEDVRRSPVFSDE